MVSAKRVKVALEELRSSEESDGDGDSPQLFKLLRTAVFGEGAEKKHDSEAIALLRMGAQIASEETILQDSKIAAKETAIEEEEGDCEVHVFQMVVPNGKALNPENPERPEWIKSILDEKTPLFEKTGVLKLVHPREVKKGDEVLPSMLILTRKSCGRKKARVVACGNFQRVQPHDVYSGVVSHESWMQNVVLALRMNHSVVQIDVSTAFLQTDECDDDEKRVKTFLRPPKHVPVEEKEKDLLWHVSKSIYGLRSAPKSWKTTLVRWAETIGFEHCPLDENVFTRKDGAKLLIYVDDLIFLGPEKIVQGLIDLLRKRFECTDPVWIDRATKENKARFLGHRLWIDGKKKKKLHISQEDYCIEMIEKVGMADCKGLKTLKPEDFDRDELAQGPKLSPEDQSKLRQLVGGIQFLANGTRSDLMAPTSAVAEGQSGGTEAHLAAAKKIIRYIQHTKKRHIVIDLTELSEGDELEVRTDFDASFGKS